MSKLSPRHVMVIFGAGASFDSISEPEKRSLGMARAFERENPSQAVEATFERLDWKPPRTSELFGQRRFFQEAIDHYPAAGTLIDARLRGLDAKTNSVEAVLDALSSEARGDQGSMLLRRQLASVRFYLREVLWQCGEKWEHELAPAQTNYHRLVERLVRWQEVRQASGAQTIVSLVTFNYDFMLDRAVQTHALLDLSNLDGYMTRDFRLFKPHGSVNWARGTTIRPPAESPMRSVDPTQRLLAGSAQLIRMAGEDPSGIPAGTGWSVIPAWTEIFVPNPEGSVLGFPAITVPVVSKDSFEMPGSHLDELRQAIDTVTHLLVIGWRAREQNFLDLWRPGRQSRPTLQVVSTQNSAAETTRTLMEAGIAARSVPPVTVGFSSYMGGAYSDSSELYRFLDQPLSTIGLE